MRLLETPLCRCSVPTNLAMPCSSPTMTPTTSQPQPTSRTSNGYLATKPAIFDHPMRQKTAALQGTLAWSRPPPPAVRKSKSAGSEVRCVKFLLFLPLNSFRSFAKLRQSVSQIYHSSYHFKLPPIHHLVFLHQSTRTTKTVSFLQLMSSPCAPTLTISGLPTTRSSSNKILRWQTKITLGWKHSLFP